MNSKFCRFCCIFSFLFLFLLLICLMVYLYLLNNFHYYFLLKLYFYFCFGCLKFYFQKNFHCWRFLCFAKSCFEFQMDFDFAHKKHCLLLLLECFHLFDMQMEYLSLIYKCNNLRIEFSFSSFSLVTISFTPAIE